MLAGWARSARRRGRPAAILALAVLSALPDCGGSTPTTPPTTTTTLAPAPTPPPVPTTLADLSASVTSPQADTSISCGADLRARVTLVNNGGTDVAVRGVLKRVGITAGRCSGDNEFTYTPRTPVAPAKTTTIVLDRSLYTNGPGCCNGTGCGSSCRIQEGFEVVTDVGNVPAGTFNYMLFFQNCPSCFAASAAGRAGCARIPAVP